MGEAGDDLVGGLHPHVGPRALVPVGDPGEQTRPVALNSCSPALTEDARIVPEARGPTRTSTGCEHGMTVPPAAGEQTSCLAIFLFTVKRRPQPRWALEDGGRPRGASKWFHSHLQRTHVGAPSSGLWRLCAPRGAGRRPRPCEERRSAGACGADGIPMVALRASCISPQSRQPPSRRRPRVLSACSRTVLATTGRARNPANPAAGG